MKMLFQFGFIFLGFGMLMAAPTKPDALKKNPAMTLEEIASLTKRVDIERLAQSRGIPFDIQTEETMRAQGIPASGQFGATSRLVLTFWIKNGDDTVTAHVSFFLDPKGHVLGRTILLENNNVP